MTLATHVWDAAQANADLGDHASLPQRLKEHHGIGASSNGEPFVVDSSKEGVAEPLQVVRNSIDGGEAQLDVGCL